MDILWPTSSQSTAYEEGRLGRIFNQRRPNRYPIAVVKAQTESDIVNTIKLAIEKNCKVSVRSGGCSWAAWSVRNNAILIDLGNYQDIEIDAEKKIARVSPSVTGKVLNGKLIHDHGLMFGGGHCPDVGLGGFLLQGGMGWNCRNWGWACEQVQAIDVVTAEGQLLHCDQENHSDLFWAARGAGPGFPGILTRFHLKLREAPKCIRSSGYIYPKHMYREAFNWVVGLPKSYDNDTAIAAVCHFSPAINDFCLLVTFLTMKNTPEEADKALFAAQESRPNGTVKEWFSQSTTIEEEYNHHAAANPPDHRYYVDSAYIANDADVPELLENAFLMLPNKTSFILWYALNPTSRRKLPDMAFSMQSDHYVGIYGIWKSEKDDEKHIRWVRETMADLEKHSEGTYIGDTDFRVRSSKYWGNEQEKKLMEIRQKWDPEGRICGYLTTDDEKPPAASL